MNKKVYWDQETSKPLDVLIRFCQEFENKWVSSGVIKWTYEDYALRYPEEFIEQVVSLNVKIQELNEILDEVHIYTRKHLRPSSNMSQHLASMSSPEYFAMNMLDCIWHDLAEKLARVNDKTEILINKKIPQNLWSEMNIGIAISLKACDLMVKKAFPLLLQQKSYLDIDWQSEFKALENFTFS